MHIGRLRLRLAEALPARKTCGEDPTWSSFPTLAPALSGPSLPNSCLDECNLSNGEKVVLIFLSPTPLLPLHPACIPVWGYKNFSHMPCEPRGTNHWPSIHPPCWTSDSSLLNPPVILRRNLHGINQVMTEHVPKPQLLQTFLQPCLGWNWPDSSCLCP